jgi:hypothetical protein
MRTHRRFVNQTMTRFESGRVPSFSSIEAALRSINSAHSSTVGSAPSSMPGQNHPPMYR